MISLLAGVVFSPPSVNFIKPLEYAGSQENLDEVTLAFTRLVLGVQLVLAGIQLPSKYLLTEWKSLALLLGPIMTSMWLCTGLLVWALVPGLPLLHALAVGSCVTPTDPILSNVIVKGKFADKNVPEPLQQIIIAESGANDGLGYPFLFFALYLIKHLSEGGGAGGVGGGGGEGGAGAAMGVWFYETWAYTILLSIAYGAVVGLAAKYALRWAMDHRYVDRESFLVFAISLALFTVGTCGMIGSDDVLACFIAGNAFTWDDWFRVETMDDSLQPTIDMLLNVSIFMWFGAVCPWHSFVQNDVISLGRLVGLGILILLLRRLPFVLAAWKFIHQIQDFRQAVFVGFFGPIGVSAIFYLYVSLEFIKTLDIGEHISGTESHSHEDLHRLEEALVVVVWFAAVCSIVSISSGGKSRTHFLTLLSPKVVHGLTIPMGKLGLVLPRTLSQLSVGTPTRFIGGGSGSSAVSLDRGAAYSRPRSRIVDTEAQGETAGLDGAGRRQVGDVQVAADINKGPGAISGMVSGSDASSPALNPGQAPSSQSMLESESYGTIGAAEVTISWAGPGSETAPGSVGQQTRGVSFPPDVLQPRKKDA